jgi:phage shock protein A
MAGTITRLKRITVPRIRAFLETVEEPEVIFPQLVRELQDGIEIAVNAEIKAAAAFKANQRRLDESMGRSIRLERGAELALRQGDEALAREALAEQIKVDRAGDDQRFTLQQSEAALLQARGSRLHLQAQLEELNRRKKEIITRARSAGHVMKTYTRTENIRTARTAILDEISRIQQVDNENGILSGKSVEPSGKTDRSLELRLRAIEREAEIERRLASIRNRKHS